MLIALAALAFAAGVDVANCSNNNTPQACPEFEQLVRNVLANPRNSVDPSILSTVTWINDGGTMNAGYRHMDGIDWNWSYDYDAGDLGAFNIGQTGTYYLHDWTANFNGAVPTDQFNQVLPKVAGLAQGWVDSNGITHGVETLPRMHYRGRLGWSDGPFSVIGFVNYQGHFYNTQGAPPNVNFSCTTAGGTVGAAGATFPCAIRLSRITLAFPICVHALGSSLYP